MPHYMRWWRYGDPVGTSIKTPEEFFWDKVDTSGECWLWTGSINENGYGVFRRGRGGKHQRAHRFAYTLLVGEIPSSLQLDHRATCPKNCVNPAHLRPVTTKQNQENRAGAQRNNMTSGVRGVSWDKSRKRWEAYVTHNLKRIHVGRFVELEDAVAAVQAKRNELFTHNDLDRLV
jgi:hypothetical protein